MHIGRLIKQQLEAQDKTKSIDTDLLLRICVLLKYDFFSAYSKELKKSVPNE